MSSFAWDEHAKTQRLSGVDPMLRCPRCTFGLGYLPDESDNSSLLCPRCLLEITCRNGIWKALPPAREAYFERFMMEYEMLCGGSVNANTGDEAYLRLPYGKLGGEDDFFSSIRASTYRFIAKKLLPALGRRGRARLTILDIGAGNGWLSYRLSQRGHTSVAVDVLAESAYGLAAAVHYRSALPKLFPRFQAEMDRLPFEDSQFDAVVFNNSFHYSENYVLTLAEALRCARTGALLIIANTPCYAAEISGVQMVAERQLLFRAKFGIPCEGLASQEYLTPRRLGALADRFDLKWRIDRPWHGWRHALAPFIAKVRGAGESAHFEIYTAQIYKSDSGSTR